MSDRCGIKIMLLLLKNCIFYLLLLRSGIMSEEVPLNPPVQINNLCSEDPSCLSLSKLAHNVSKYLRATTTLIFLPGNHSLESKLSIVNISILTLFSINS